MLRHIKFASRSALQLIYPASCCICENDLMINENHVCSKCAYDLPYITTNEQDVTKLTKLFWGRVDIEQIHSYLNYQKGNSVQAILHHIKYKSRPKIATHFGRLLAKSIPTDHSYKSIVPVPLHPKKLLKRGFNQSMAIAEGLSEILEIPINEKCIKRNAYNESQTKFSKYDRYENVRSIFTVTKPEQVKGQHILLVDDVLTTGATIEACAAALLMVEGCKVSIATLAARV
jgi:competence protein ComFC